jgi:hypothetical protein
MPPPTNINILPLPTDVLKHLGPGRTTEILQHAIKVNLDWWNAKLDVHGLPGGPVQGRNAQGATIKSGVALITRGDVFAYAQNQDSVYPLFWHSLAWGAGFKLRLCHRRMIEVQRGGPNLGKSLQAAAVSSRTDPGAAYLMLCPSTSSSLVKYLGPAFATKFLYFAGAGNPSHPSLILDSVVAGALRRYGWASLSSKGAWPSSTYVRYCDLLGRWAGVASPMLGRTVSADEIEKALFVLGP